MTHLEILSDYLLPDLGRLALTYLPKKEIFIRAWGHNHLNYPTGIAVSRSGEIYVIDTNHHRIAVFNDHGDLIQTQGLYGKKEGYLYYPRGIALSKDSSRIFVADTNNNRIQVFSVVLKEQSLKPSDHQESSKSDSKQVPLKIKFLGQWGSYGNGDGQFDAPCAIAVSSDRRIYVAESRNGRVQVFTLSDLGDDPQSSPIEAKFVRFLISGKESFHHRPTGLALSRDEKEVFVAYPGYIQVFSSQGVPMRGWGTRVTEKTLITRDSVSLSSDGNIYVCSSNDNIVSLFNPHGQLIRTWRVTVGWEGSLLGVVVREDRLYFTGSNSTIVSFSLDYY
jgi:DNA-binding beta-propeller fold protein YncE